MRKTYGYSLLNFQKLCNAIIILYKIFEYLTVNNKTLFILKKNKHLQFSLLIGCCLKVLMRVQTIPTLLYYFHQCQKCSKRAKSKQFKVTFGSPKGNLQKSLDF